MVGKERGADVERGGGGGGGRGRGGGRNMPVAAAIRAAQCFPAQEFHIECFQVVSNKKFA